MDATLRAILVAAFLTPWAFAGETADVSLDKEVDKYLEASASKWDDPATMRAQWNKHLTFETSDGMFKISIGGRLMWDNFWTTTGSSDFGGSNPFGNGTYFRRARLRANGDVYGKVTFYIQYDFAAAAFRNVYVGLKKIWGSGGTLLFGHQKESFSIYEMTSSRYIQMIERPMPVSAFAPGYNSGVALYSGPLANKRMTVSGFFGWGQSGNLGQQLNSGGGGGAFTFRVTGLAIHNPEKRTYFHLGFSGSYRNFAGETAQYRTRPELGAGPRVADTGTFAAEAAFHYSFELAFLWRSLSVVAEFLGSETSGPPGSGDHSFWGYYIEIGYWITGESKPYNVQRGTFSRVSPKRNFHDGQGGWGAWEVVLRWDVIDLNSTNGGFVVAGGKTTAIAGGANWHWNPNARVMFNIVFADVRNGPLGTGDVVALVIRVQFDF